MIARVNRFVGLTLSYGYAIVAILTFSEVVARYFFNSPTQWSIEVVILIASLHYLMSGAHAYADDTHIRITILVDRLSPRTRRAFRIIEHLTVTAVCVLVCIYAWRQAAFAISIGERSGSNWNTPSPTILKTVVVIAIAMILLQALDHLVRTLRQRDEP